MGGTAACVNVQSVRFIVDHIGGCPQGVKHAFSDHPCAPVGTVQSHLHVLIGAGGQGNEIARVPVPARGMIHGAADPLPDR